MSVSGQAAFAGLQSALADVAGVEGGQMFGKACLKVGGKAFMAQQQDRLAFKLSGPVHAAALAEQGAALWDPSGAGRPMKEWVAIPASEPARFQKYAEAALSYVRG